MAALEPTRSSRHDGRLCQLPIMQSYCCHVSTLCWFQSLSAYRLNSAGALLKASSNVNSPPLPGTLVVPRTANFLLSWYMMIFMGAGLTSPRQEFLYIIQTSALPSLFRSVTANVLSTK